MGRGGFVYGMFDLGREEDINTVVNRESYPAVTPGLGENPGFSLVNPTRPPDLTWVFNMVDLDINDPDLIEKVAMLVKERM